MQEYIINTNEKAEEFITFVTEEFDNLDIVAFDLETNGTNEKAALIYGIGLAFNEDEAFYIPVRGNNDDSFFNSDVTSRLNELVARILAAKRIIGHNVIFDTLVWYNNYGSDISENIHSDTILMKHMLDEERPFGLKEVAVKYLGPWADKAQKALYDNIVANGGSITKDNLQMFKADTDVLGVYCCYDVLLTYKLYNLFSVKLKEEGLEDLFYKDEVMPLYKLVTIPMKKHGIHVDVPYFKQLLKDVEVDIERLAEAVVDWLEDNLGLEYEEYLMELLNDVAAVKKKGGYPKALATELGEVLPDSLSQKSLAANSHLQTVKWIQNVTDIPVDVLLRAQLRLFFEKKEQTHVFNLNSKTQLKRLFFDILKEDPLTKTDTGEPQVDDDFLDSIKDDYGFVPMLQDLNKLNKIKSTYIEGVLDREYEGVIYTSMLQFGTTSGRYSSTNPNLQNLPRPQEEDSALSEIVLKYNNAIRKGFIAPKGYKFIDTDYSALEPRCFSHMSGSKDLQNIFHSGTDMYSAIAIQMFKMKGVSANKKDDNFLGKLHPEKRQQVKAFCLAVVYGAESYRIAGLLNMERAEAQKLIDMYMDAFPDLRKYIENCHYEVNTKGYVSTIFGRVRHLQRGKELFKMYGYNLLDSRWARKNNLADERREYKNLLNNSTNFRIQGLAGHIINRASIRISQEFKRNNIDGWICLNIHDQCICSVADKDVELARNIVRDAMQNIVKLDVPLIAEPAIATNMKDGH